MRDSIYQDEVGRKLLQQSYCAYLDILGFSNKIQDNDIPFFNKYLETLNTELKHIDDNHDLSGNQGFKKFELKIFTDNFVFGYPWFEESGESEIGSVFDILGHMQFMFAISNIFIRGALSISHLYMDTNIVIGPAIIETYQLEKNKSIYPRIIFSDKVIEVIKSHLRFYGDPKESPQNFDVLIDFDGNYFLNYLYLVIEHFRHDKEKIVEYLLKHKNVIEKNLLEYKDDFKIFDKYSWVAQYHNYFCEQFLKEHDIADIDRIIIDHDVFAKSIKRIV